MEFLHQIAKDVADKTELAEKASELAELANKFDDIVNSPAASTQRDAADRLTDDRPEEPNSIVTVSDAYTLPALQVGKNQKAKTRYSTLILIFAALAAIPSYPYILEFLRWIAGAFQWLFQS